jgi:beta-glucanase (GH16 family)
MIRRRMVLAAIVGALAAGPVASHAVVAAVPPTGGDCGGAKLHKPDGSRWICTFDDEFTGTKLDRVQWTPQLTANSDFTSGTSPHRACYVDNPKTISVSHGYLHLSVIRTAKPFTCTAPGLFGLGVDNFATTYQAGEITTYYGFAQTYGRFEVRAKMPSVKVPGLQETLWLWPKNDTKYGGFPGSGEIDFAEFYSRYSDRVIPYVHYDYAQSSVDPKTNTNIVTNDYTCLIDTTRFHRYVAIWKPGKITLKYDGKTCLVDNYRPSNVRSPAPFDQPFFMALTQALGVTGNEPTSKTPIPATMKVDYVRVWR